MRLSLKTGSLAALACLLTGAAGAQPGGRFGAVIDAAAEGCPGAEAPDAAAALQACARTLTEITAIGSRIAPDAGGAPLASHYLARRAAIELRISALQGVLEGEAHPEVCHWASAAAKSAAGVVMVAGDAEAGAAYGPALQAAKAAAAACEGAGSGG